MGERCGRRAIEVSSGFAKATLFKNPFRNNSRSLPEFMSWHVVLRSRNGGICSVPRCCHQIFACVPPSYCRPQGPSIRLLSDGSKSQCAGPAEFAGAAARLAHGVALAFTMAGDIAMINRSTLRMGPCRGEVRLDPLSKPGSATVERLSFFGTDSHKLVAEFAGSELERCLSLSGGDGDWHIDAKGVGCRRGGEAGVFASHSASRLGGDVHMTSRSSFAQNLPFR